MTTVKEPAHGVVDALLADVVCDNVRKRLADSSPGHCLRVSALPWTIMLAVCTRLCAEHLNADVVSLVAPHQSPEYQWQITPTRLIQLRNAEERPLVAFVPPGMQVAAEDSFDISTFSEIELEGAPVLVAQRLAERMPRDILALTNRIVRYLQRAEASVALDDIVRFYATIVDNGASADVAGGAIYQLHLIPDFGLLREPKALEERLDRNVTVVRTLSEGNQPLSGRIRALKLKAGSIQDELYAFLRQQNVDEVGTWTRYIATEPAYRHLSFDQWEFERETGGDRILLTVEDPDLPVQQADQPAGPDNPRYLDLGKARDVPIKWVTEPKPRALPEGTYFRVQIVSTDEAIAWESGNIRNSTSASASRSKRIKLDEFREQMEDGLYYFRVRAYTESGETINDEDPANVHTLRDPGNPEGKQINESEDVWFWKGDAPPPAEPVKNIAVNSYLAAQLHVQLSEMERHADPFAPTLIPRPDRTGWSTGKGRRSEGIYNIVYNAQARYTLSISNVLRNIESRTLAEPEMLGLWRVNFAAGQPRQDVQPTVRQTHESLQISPEFLEARKALFDAIRCGSADCLTCTVDLTSYQDQIIAYAEAYHDWLEKVQNNFEDLAVYTEGERRHTYSIFLDLDTVEVVLPNSTPMPDRVYLVAPTHPVCLLWHLQRSLMAHTWLHAAADSDQRAQSFSREMYEYLINELIPVNLPPIIRPMHDSHAESVQRFYVEQAPITLFWRLYVREDMRDRRALQARLLEMLGITRPIKIAEIGGIDFRLLAKKLRRYLVQHPYVDALKINVFNPGAAGPMVDAILDIEGDRSDLRYEFRLFAPSDSTDDIGQAVEELLNPQRQVSAEADAFTEASQNHLFPKLRLGRHRLQDFLENPQYYEAHISILHDLFPIDVELDAPKSGRSSYVHGLIQENVTSFSGSGAHYAWQRQLLPRQCTELEGTPAISAMLSSILTKTAQLQASTAAGRKVDNAVPTLQLNLAVDGKNLLYQIHSVSDWVFIVDRHLGLEYFDSQATDDRPLYLLDYAPEFASPESDRMLLTTRSVEEVTRLIRPALADRNLLVGDDVEVYFLYLLRSLSGRLALKLLSSPNSVSEALGLGMARLFLEQYGLLNDRIVLPLDTHGDLFGPESAQEDTSLERGDLLLVSCDSPTRTINFQIIEVKWRTYVGDLSAYTALCQQIELQITRSEAALRQHFDPHLQQVDRIDRQVKTKELIGLLSFYLERSMRYGLVSDRAALELHSFIETLDQGYDLTCTGAGLVFDFSSHGVTHQEEHAGLVYHRMGRDYIERLLHNGLRRSKLLQSQQAQLPSGIEDIQKGEEARKQIIDKTSMDGDESYEPIRTHFTPPRTMHMPVAGSTTSTSPVLPSSSMVQSDVRPPVNGRVKPAPSILSEIPASGTAKQDAAPASLSAAPRAEPGLPVRSAPEPQAQPAVSESRSTAPHSPTSYDVLLGDGVPTKQYGVLGRAAGQIVALDLNGTNTISLFGVQGGGKSYTVGSIVEMATQPIAGINELPAPLASVIFHYHESQDYPPEFVSMVAPNDDEAQVRALVQEYGALPARLKDVVILTSGDKLAKRRIEFPSVQVEPIYFSSSELSIKDWRFLMGVGGGQMYMKQINMIMRQLREQMTLDTLREEIEASELSDSQKTIARIRLKFAEQFIDDSRRLAAALKPGRLIIVDLRDEFIDKDEALGLFVVMLSIFANAGHDQGFNKLIVFDEAHKYMDNPDLTSHIVEVIRQMRHQGVSVLIASQDPPSLPTAIIELSSLVILHRFNSPLWLKHVQHSITALSDVTPAQMAMLGAGDAYVWATKSTERIFTQKAVRMHFRPRVTRHGGGTKTAV